MTTFDPVTAPARGLVHEDLLNFSWLDEIALAPDGRRVAYTVKRPHSDTNSYETHLFVRALNAGDEPSAVQITAGYGRATAVAWDRAGRRLAFVWTDGRRHSVEIWADDAGDRRSFPIDGAPFSGLAWSADGRRLAGARWTPWPAADEPPRADGIPPPQIKVIRRLRYKQDGVGWVHDRYQQIWLLELPGGAMHQVTRDECDYSEPSWSGAGRRLAFIGLAREQNVALGQGQIFIYDDDDRAAPPRRLLPDWAGACRSPQWGAGDRQIAFAGHEHPAPTNRRVFMQPYLADVAAGTARALAPDIDEEVGNYAVADQRKGLSNITVKWAPGDDWIYFLLTERGGSHLYRIDTAGAYECLVRGDSVTFEYSPAPGAIAAYGQANPQSPGELFLWQDGRTEQLTDLNPWLATRQLAEPRSYTYAGVDGTPVQAWVITPPGVDDGVPRPTILYVHCSMFSWDFNHEFQCYANAGYVVAYFNQRGTTAGYGQAWTRASEGDQGGRDYEEIMLGVDELVARPYVDETRLGVTGGSCGGFMTNWIVGHTDRFAAAVTQRSITNQISFFGNSDIGPECTLGETGATPWTDLDAVWHQSPIAYADQVTTPLLIIHSDEDHRCALEQAEQLFAALRWLGKEVELVIFEGESHGLSRGGRPGNRLERLRRIQGWFDDHLRPSPAPV